MVNGVDHGKIREPRRRSIGSYYGDGRHQAKKAPMLMNFRSLAVCASICVFSLWTFERALADKPVKLECKELSESSGVAVCLGNPDLVWTHNDSGGKPRLYLMSRTKGKLHAVYDVQGAANIDWEDMCSFTLAGKNYLAIGDIGDNQRRREYVEICVIEEPSIPKSSQPSSLETPIPISLQATLRVRYPDGAYDCEALAFDPQQNSFILLTKELLTCRVMEVPIDVKLLNDSSGQKGECRATLLQAFSLAMITGADICPETRQLVVCNYGAAYTLQPDSAHAKLWNAKSMKRLDAPKRQQGEAIAFAGPKRLLYTSEASPAPLWTVELD